MRKFLIGLSAVALFVSLAVAETTTTVTNRGQVIIVKTLDNVATDVRDLDVIQDTSTYASKVGERGTIVRWYDYGRFPNTEARRHMKPEIPLPDNALIQWGFLDTVTAFDSANHISTNKISFLTSGDIFAGATNTLFATGTDETVPVVETDTTWIQSTSATNYLDIESIGETNTAGKVMVVLEYILVP